VTRIDNTAGRTLFEACGGVLDFEAPDGLCD
jgi:hypothetical protein